MKDSYQGKANNNGTNHSRMRRLISTMIVVYIWYKKVFLHDSVQIKH